MKLGNTQKKKELKDYKKKLIKILIIKTLVFVCICAILFSSLFFSNFFEKYINHLYFDFSKNISNLPCKVHYINVGQGDCSFVELPDGKTLMIDTGPVSSIDSVERYLKILGINYNDTIDYLILTHTDSDHIGNAKEIIKNYNIENIYIPKVYSSYEVENNLNVYDYNIVYGDLWAQTTKAIYQNVDNINYSFKDLVIESSEANYSLVFYSPFNNKESSSNDYSPIIVLNYNNNKFMFVGDISEETEQEFLSYYSEVLSTNYFDVDVLKVSHHGSKNSTTTQFLNVVKPEFAIISCGEDNSYNHPSNDTINRLVDFGCEIYRTDVSGSVVCATSSEELFIQSNYEEYRSFYFEWWNFVVTFIVITFYAVYFVKYKKETKDNKQ